MRLFLLPNAMASVCVYCILMYCCLVINDRFIFLLLKDEERESSNQDVKKEEDPMVESPSNQIMSSNPVTGKQ